MEKTRIADHAAGRWARYVRQTVKANKTGQSFEDWLRQLRSSRSGVRITRTSEHHRLRRAAVALPEALRRPSGDAELPVTRRGRTWMRKGILYERRVGRSWMTVKTDRFWQLTGALGDERPPCEKPLGKEEQICAYGMCGVQAINLRGKPATECVWCGDDCDGYRAADRNLALPTGNLIKRTRSH